LTFKRSIVQVVARVQKSIKKKSKRSDLTLVGIHVRRGDYKDYLWNKYRATLLRCELSWIN